MKTMGKLLECDRCGEHVFLPVVEQHEAYTNGGIEQYNVYEDAPAGWSYASEIGDMCPTCAEEYRLLLDEFKKMYKRDSK